MKTCDELSIPLARTVSDVNVAVESSLRSSSTATALIQPIGLIKAAVTAGLQSRSLLGQTHGPVELMNEDGAATGTNQAAISILVRSTLLESARKADTCGS